MFTNVGWSEILVLGVVALVVLGPERLPEAARWLAGAVRKVKDFAGSAQQQLKDDYGTDFDEFREPLKQLNDLRGLSPRAMVTKHLLDGDDSLFSGDFNAAAPAGGGAGSGAQGAGTPSPASRPGASQQARGSQPTGSQPTGSQPSGTTPPGSSTDAGAAPLWDTDAT